MTSRQWLKRLVPPAPRRPQRSKEPSPSELLIQERSTPLVEALTALDEPCRRATVEHVLRTCIPALVARLIEKLVDLLGAGTIPRQALASLAQLGGRLDQALQLPVQRGFRACCKGRGILPVRRDHTSPVLVRPAHTVEVCASVVC
jgi:hypothetical protein